MTIDKVMADIERARDSITVKRVYGEPIERDGVVLVPAAVVIGGTGGGVGRKPDALQGTGSGFGVIAWPVGAYVIKDGKVRWRPTVDVTLLGLVLGAGGLLAAVRIVRLALGSQSPADRRARRRGRRVKKRRAGRRR